MNWSYIPKKWYWNMEKSTNKYLKRDEGFICLCFASMNVFYSPFPAFWRGHNPQEQKKPWGCFEQGVWQRFPCCPSGRETAASSRELPDPAKTPHGFLRRGQRAKPNAGAWRSMQHPCRMPCWNSTAQIKSLAGAFEAEAWKYWRIAMTMQKQEVTKQAQHQSILNKADCFLTGFMATQAQAGNRANGPAGAMEGHMPEKVL